MSNKRITKLSAISLPPEIHNIVEEHIKKTHQTRSEFYREMIDAYFGNRAQNINRTFEQDVSFLLKNYWDKKSEYGPEIVIIGLAIITNGNNEVIIGSRKSTDKYVENLSWVFPGGHLRTLDFENDIHKLVKTETNLNVQVKNLITSRIHPDSGFKSTQIIALYFHCTALNTDKMSPGGSLNNLKLVKPLDVFKYFTTSTSDDVTKFLTMLQRTSQI